MALDGEDKVAGLANAYWYIVICWQSSEKRRDDMDRVFRDTVEI